MGQSRHRAWFAFENLTRQPGGVETGGQGSGNLRVPAGGEQQGRGPEAQASVPLRPRKASGETDRARLCPQKLLGAHELGGHAPSARIASGPGGTYSDCYCVCSTDRSHDFIFRVCLFSDKRNHICLHTPAKSKV